MTHNLFNQTVSWTPWRLHVMHNISIALIIIINNDSNNNNNNKNNNSNNNIKNNCYNNNEVSQIIMIRAHKVNSTILHQTTPGPLVPPVHRTLVRANVDVVLYVILQYSLSTMFVIVTCVDVHCVPTATPTDEPETTWPVKVNLFVMHVPYQWVCCIQSTWWMTMPCLVSRLAIRLRPWHRLYLLNLNTADIICSLYSNKKLCYLAMVVVHCAVARCTEVYTFCEQRDKVHGGVLTHHVVVLLCFHTCVGTASCQR